MSVLAADTLTGTGVQAVTGAKTFNDQKLIRRNPAGTFSLTEVHPAITANYNSEFQRWGTYLIYIAGSNKKRMNLTTRAVEDTNTDASTVINAALAALPGTSGSRLLLNTGFYSLVTTVTPPSYCHIQGEADAGITQLRPTTNIPAIELAGKANVTLESLYVTHTQAGYTSSLINLKNATADCTVKNCYGWDSDNKVGSFIGLDATTGSVYRNNFIGGKWTGFDSSINANIGNSTYFETNNRFLGVNFYAPKRVLKITSVSGGNFDDNHFISCEMQAYASSICGFDYETGHSGHSFYTNHMNCMVQDLTGTMKYALLNNTTELSLVGCYPTWKIGGAGATLGKIRAFDQYSVNRGTSSQNGNASTKVFNIAHSLPAAPSKASVIAGHADALGPFVVTKDATNVIVTYPIAPPTGSSNVVLNWEASVF